MLFGEFTHRRRLLRAGVHAPARTTRCRCPAHITAYIRRVLRPAGRQGLDRGRAGREGLRGVRRAVPHVRDERAPDRAHFGRRDERHGHALRCARAGSTWTRRSVWRAGWWNTATTAWWWPRTTGEASHADPMPSAATWSRAVAEAVTVPVLAGTGSNDTAHSVALTRKAKGLGAAGVLLVGALLQPPAAGRHRGALPRGRRRHRAAGDALRRAAAHRPPDRPRGAAAAVPRSAQHRRVQGRHRATRRRPPRWSPQAGEHFDLY